MDSKLLSKPQTTKKKPLSSQSSSGESGSESSSSETLNSDQILLNKLLFEAQGFYRSREKLLASEKYTQALKLAEKLQNSEKIAMLKAILAIIAFENGDYKDSKRVLEESLVLVGGIKKGELLLELRLKILCSLCVVSIVLNQFDKAKEYGSRISAEILGINNLAAKKSGIELVVFSLFKFLNFQSMSSVSLENIEELYQGVPLACFYSTLGLNRELNSDYQQALQFYLKALDVWKNCSEVGLVLITLKHLISLAPRAGLNVSDTANFMKLYQKLLQADEFKNVNVEGLFRDYEQRLETAREIAMNIKRTEESIQIMSEGKGMMSSDFLKSSTLEFEGNVNQNAEPIWKQALKLRLLKSLKEAKRVLSEPGSKVQKTGTSYSQLLAEGTDQILTTLQMLNEESNRLILDKLKNLAFTKEALTQLRAAINKLRKFMTQLIFAESFRLIRQKSGRKAMKPTVPSLLTKSLKALAEGDYLIKCNNSSNNRLRKYFRLENGRLLVANKEAIISNPEKRRQLALTEIDAVVYGKTTTTLLKLYNKPLESHFCFSLWNKGKTIDFYCNEGQLTPWLLGLSAEVKKRNPRAYCLSLGRLLWRGVRLRLLDLCVKLSKKNETGIGFARAILLVSKRRKSLQ